MNNNKIPCISTIFHENEFIIVFKRKADTLNHFSTTQCKLVEKNTSKIPAIFESRKLHSLSTIDFTNNGFEKVIKNLDPDTIHGYDMISIRIIKICWPSACKPLEFIFRSCVISDEFPFGWKKPKVFSVHKKGNKWILNNYWQISLLLICEEFPHTKCSNCKLKMNSFYQIKWVSNRQTRVSVSFSLSLMKYMNNLMKVIL